MSWRVVAVVRMTMPSTRMVAIIGTILVLLGLVGLAVGAVLLVANTGPAVGGSAGLKGLGVAIGMVLLVGGLLALLAGVFLLTRGRVGQTRARTTVPGMPVHRASTSMLPGGALVFAAIVLGFVAIGGATWLLVPAALAGLAGIVLFSLSGSPDEPA